MDNLIPNEIVTKKILSIRGHKVMLDQDLANISGVETKVFKQAVKRTISRFPDDFMFVLTNRGGTRYKPMAFTEQGIAMLFSVLKSERAIEVNIAIIRAFVQMRQMLATHDDLRKKIEEMESKYD